MTRPTWVCLAVLALLRLNPAHAESCQEKVERHCAGIYGAGGTDVIQADKPLDTQPQIIDMEIGKSPKPRLTRNFVGKSSLKIQWRVRPFSCVKYTVRYCTR